jgi:menaquinone-dependent protoporphyrinogen oxidase
MADRVLVASGSKFGSTAEIAEAIATTLRNAGLDLDVKPARDVQSLDRTAPSFSGAPST